MFGQLLAPIAGSLPLSALVAALPPIAMFVLLGVFRVKAPVAAGTALALALLLALAGWQMPAGQAMSSVFYGVLYGLFPILWILVNAVWIYRMADDSGWFSVLGRRIRAVSPDLRIQAILIAFCFGALLEALAGFGAPVAISAVMLIATGLGPVRAAVVALVANTAPVAFGSMAVPITALASVTKLPMDHLGAVAGRQTPIIAAVVPLILVFLVDGRRGLRQTWPVALVAGLVFAVCQFVAANYISVEITDILAAVVTIVVVLGMVRIWRPSDVRTGVLANVGSGSGGSDSPPATDEPEQRESGKRTLLAAAPFLIIIALFSLKQIGPVKQWLSQVGTLKFAWPGLDITTPTGQPVATTFSLDHLNGTGTILLFAGVLTMLLYRLSPSRAVRCYRDTVSQLRWTIVTVTTVLGLAFVMNFSGQTASLGAGLAAAGSLFALLSPVVGWIGVAITGSDTSSNSLFGALQVAAAHKTGLDPYLLAAANSSAGVVGKMISAQNLAVAAAAIGKPGSEPEIFRKVIGWSLGLLAVFIVLIYLQSTPVLGWMLP